MVSEGVTLDICGTNLIFTSGLTDKVLLKTEGTIMHDLKDRLKEPSSWGGFVICWLRESASVLS